MKIYQNNDTLLYYSIDIDYFKTERQISQTYFTESHWNNTELKSSMLTYNIYYSLKDPDSTDYFVRYERRLTLKCLIEDIDKDTQAIIKIKDAMNVSIGKFLKQNARPFYREIDFKPFTFSESERLREKANLEWSKVSSNMPLPNSLINIHDASAFN